MGRALTTYKPRASEEVKFYANAENSERTIRVRNGKHKKSMVCAARRKRTWVSDGPCDLLRGSIHPIAYDLAIARSMSGRRKSSAVCIVNAEQSLLDGSVFENSAGVL